MANPLYDAMVELQCINFIFQSNSFQIIALNNINEDFFTTYKSHFRFIKDFYEKYNQLPSKETFQGKYGDKFEWLNITDPDTYIAEKLKEAKLYRDLISDYKDIANLIKQEKSDVAIEKMGILSQKYLKQKETPVVDLIDDAKMRYESYVKRIENHDKRFIPLGIKELDDILGGWDALNESAIVAGRTGFGKSWWLIFFALEAAKKGLNVGFYSGEMEDDLVGYRLDTFLGGIANGSLTHGNDNVKAHYEQYIANINKMVSGHIYVITPEMLGGNATVSKLKAFIEKYSLEFLCIDQYSLLDDEKKGKTIREQMFNLSKDLRSLQRLKKIPIISASQLNRENTNDSGGATTRNISEADRIGQDATTVIFIERKEDKVVFTIGKARNAKSGDKLTYVWNINLGTLHYVPTEKDAKNGMGSKEVEQSYNDKNKSNTVF